MGTHLKAAFWLMWPPALAESQPSLHMPQSPQRSGPHGVVPIVKVTPELATGTHPDPCPRKGGGKAGRKGEGPPLGSLSDRRGLAIKLLLCTGVT